MKTSLYSYLPRRAAALRATSPLFTGFCIWLLLGTAAAALAAPKPALPEPLRLTNDWTLQDAAKVSQTGDAISQTGFQASGWYRATVPGTVLTTLVNNEVYPEPLYGENNRPNKIPDTLCRSTYWYRTPFTVPQTFAGKQIWLNFEGINYMAAIWVNGQQVGTIKGAFTRGIFDVTRFVKIGGPNALAVHVFPQPHPGDTHEKTVANGTGPNGGITGIDGPTFLCTIGWDWIPTIRDRATGIWQDVTLSATGPVVVQDPFVTSDLPLPRTDTADLTVKATVSNATDLAQSGVLSGVIEGIKFQQDVSLSPREARTITFSPANVSALHLRAPRLWWPNGYGPQNLYKLHLAFSTKGNVSDAQDVTFGIRKITYALPGSDNLALSVNGVPVIVKGGDWGMDEAMKRIPRKRLEAMVRMHQLANYTMIRNWVGQSTSKDLYDLCDQYGILMWDEFFEPHPNDGPVPTDVGLYLANVRDKVLRFRNHPSIALWCARNEGDPPPNIGQGIQKILAELDPIRLYQPSSTSGRGVNSGGPYYWRIPREYYSWGEAFKTEVGSVSVPTLEAVRGMMPAKDWEVVNDDWAEHDLCAGAQQGDLFPVLIANRYGTIASLPDFVRKSQLATYEAFRAMYEGRFAKLFHPATGVITWMSSPAQPSFVWQLYSHDLEPNSALYGARKACEPIHIQANQNNWHLMVINNAAHQLTQLAAKTTVYNLDGSLQYSHTDTVTAAPSAATDVGPIAFPANLSPVHFVKVELRDAKGKLVSENFYWRTSPNHEDNFQPLNTLPMVTLDIQAKRHDAKDKCRLEVTLSNPAKAVALMTHLQLRKANSGQRVLPVFYSDNYVSLLPGETKSLTVEAAMNDLGGEQPLLAVDGWNVTVPAETGAANAVRVVNNSDAQVRTPAPAEAPQVLAFNCGGLQLGLFHFGTPAPVFYGDLARPFAQGGNTSSSTNAIDTNVPNAAPAAVYQSERWGECAYVIPVSKGATYTVRLHFAETRHEPNGRKFNVLINGQRVLIDFDIAAVAGKDKAVVKDFSSVAPDESGHIVVALKKGSADQPKICGIEILK